MFFLFGAQSNENLSITQEGEQLEQVHRFKYLGFVLEKRLQFDHLFSDLYSKLNHLAKVRSYLPTRAAALVFKSKFLSYLDYANIFAYSLSKKI